MTSHPQLTPEQPAVCTNAAGVTFYPEGIRKCHPQNPPAVELTPEEAAEYTRIFAEFDKAVGYEALARYADATGEGNVLMTDRNPPAVPPAFDGQAVKRMIEFLNKPPVREWHHEAAALLAAATAECERLTGLLQKAYIEGYIQGHSHPTGESAIRKANQLARLWIRTQKVTEDGDERD